MKKIKKKYYYALIYNKQHPEISYTKIGEKFNCNRHTIKKYYDENIDFSNSLEDEENFIIFDSHEQQAIDDYKNTNKTIKEISEEYGISSITINRWTRMLNIQRVGHIEKKIFNRNAFNIINDEYDAYWLGFITADGYVNEDRNFLNIKLQEKDENHLLKFIKYMQAENVVIKDDKGGSGQIVKSITFNSKQLVENLVNLNVRQGKSGKEKPYYNIKSELCKHYIRGLIDGDGNLSHGSDYHIDYVGSYEIVKFVRDYINNNIIKLDYEYIYEHGNIYRFTCRKHEVAIACFKHFYNNALIYLDRKYKYASMAVNKSEKKTGTDIK